MKASDFTPYANRHCPASKEVVDQKSIDLVLAAAKKEPLKSNAVIIARYAWLKARNLKVPTDMELANLCVMIKEGKAYRAIYSNVLTHIIKKQNYHIQILN
jgi:hypothetical protein